MLADACIGTTGFAHRDWLGSVYPREAAPTQLLALYAERLTSVEIGPRVAGAPPFESLRAQVPPEFRFAVRAPSRLCQDLAAGRDVDRAFESFLESVLGLGSNLGPLLFQFPSRVPCDLRALAAFLDSVPRGLRLAFQPSHDSWRDEAAVRLLSAHDAALVLSDSGEGPPRLELTADFAYVRIRREGEGLGDLDEWAEKLAALLRRGVDVYAFLKHDRRGLSVERAQRLSALVRGESHVGEPLALS